MRLSRKSIDCRGQETRVRAPTAILVPRHRARGSTRPCVKHTGAAVTAVGPVLGSCGWQKSIRKAKRGPISPRAAGGSGGGGADIPPRHDLKRSWDSWVYTEVLIFLRKLVLRSSMPAYHHNGLRLAALQYCVKRPVKHANG